MYRLLNNQECLTIKAKLKSSYPIIQAVIVGLQEGRVFRSTNQDYWVLHKSGFSEVFLNMDEGSALVEFIADTISLPKYFHIYNPPVRLVEFFKLKSNFFNIRERKRVQLTYDINKTDLEAKFQINKNFCLEKVNQDNFKSLNVFGLDLSNRFWNGSEDFIKNALGVFLKDELSNPISLCYAAANVGGKAEIDVITSEIFRGKGLAKAVVMSFISDCLKNKVKANWDCFTNNDASLATANSIGFKVYYKYNFASIGRL